jgi:hypothetical protein
MIALHVPSTFAKKKNEITRILYRIGKQPDIDVREEWYFLREIEESLKMNNKEYDNSKSGIDLVELLDQRLSKGEISKEEFDHIRNILHSKKKGMNE